MDEIDKQGFRRACEQAASEEKTHSSIGTLGEKSLHAVLKWYYEQNGDCHEIRVGDYVADIVGEQGIIEIQTRNFVRLKPKLTELLEIANVTVVHPIIEQKRIINIDSKTGEVLSKRRSPKRGSIYTAVHEVYAIKPLLANQRLTLRLPLLEADEIRLFGVKTNRRKIQHTRKGEYISDIIPTDILGEIILEAPEDYRIFIPDELPQNFSSSDFASITGADIYAARRAVSILEQMGHISRKGKRGREILWSMN